MDKLKRFKSLILCIGLTALPVLIITLYGISLYTAFYDCLMDINTLLDVTKWQHLSHG